MLGQSAFSSNLPVDAGVNTNSDCVQRIFRSKSLRGTVRLGQVTVQFFPRRGNGDREENFSDTI